MNSFVACSLLYVHIVLYCAQFNISGTSECWKKPELAMVVNKDELGFESLGNIRVLLFGS
jgi:hypothetical protein